MKESGVRSEHEKDRLSAWVDPEVSGDVSQRIEELAKAVEADPEAARRVIQESQIVEWFRAEGDASFVGRTQAVVKDGARSSDFPGSTMARIRGIAEARASGRKRSLWPARGLRLAAAAVVLAAAGVWLWNAERGMGNAEVVARVEKVSGFSVQCSGEEKKPLKAGAEVRASDTIETGRDGTVKLAWANRATTVELGEDSGFRVQGSGKSQWLDHGRLTAIVAKQDPAHPFVVETPQARATVVGTKFSLAVDSRATWLDVGGGVVNFQRRADEQALDIAAGRFSVAGIDLVLKSYPEGAEYVDGAQLFVDEFDDPAKVAKWGVDVFNVFNKDGTQRVIDAALESRLLKNIRLMEAERDGRKVQCLWMGERDPEQIWQLKNEVPMGNVVVTRVLKYLKRDAADSATTMEIGGPLTSVAQLPIGTWIEIRMEHLLHEVGPGKWEREVVIFANGKLISRGRSPFRARTRNPREQMWDVSIGFSNRPQLIDRVEVRRLVRRGDLGAVKAGDVVKSFPMSRVGAGLAFDGHAVWLSDGSRRLHKMDPENGREIGSLDVGFRCGSVEWDGEKFWGVEVGASKVHAIDPVTGRSLASFSVPKDADGNAVVGVAFGGDCLWLSAGFEILKMDPRDGRVLKRLRPGPLHMNLGDIAYFNGAVWCNGLRKVRSADGAALPARYAEICKIDTETGEVVRRFDAPSVQREESDPWGIGLAADGSGGIWVAIWDRSFSASSSAGPTMRLYLVESGEDATAGRFSRRWTFADGPAKDFTVLRGAWHWEREPDGVGRMVPEEGAKRNAYVHLPGWTQPLAPDVGVKKTKVLLPVKVPARPLMLTVKGEVAAAGEDSGRMDSEFGWSAQWVPESGPQLAHSTFVVLKSRTMTSRKRVIRFVFIRRSVIGIGTTGELVSLSQYDREYPSDRILLGFGPFHPEEIELQELTPSEANRYWSLMQEFRAEQKRQGHGSSVPEPY